MRTFVILLALVLALPANAAQLVLANGYGDKDTVRNLTSVQLGQRFCQGRLTGNMSGLGKFFAPELVALLDGRPVETVPWQSVAVQPNWCEVSVLNGATDTIGVLLKLTYTAKGETWSDTLGLQRTPDSWLINNVFYENGGNLRFRLFEQ
jgi:hypothetical protein